MILRFPLIALLLLLSWGSLHATEDYKLIFDGKELNLSGNGHVLDMGVKQRGAVCSVVIKVKNESVEILHIANVRGSCGLSVPAWPRQPIAPGEEAIIQVRYDSSRPGKINRNLTISGNTHDSVTVLKVRGEILP